MRLARLLPLVAGFALANLSFVAPARAQVAFAPGVGTIPDGVALSAVPAVSADRRYVRLSIGTGFQTVDGFSNIAIPFGVSGLGSGNLGGLAGGGGGGGGFRSVGVPMGMDGPVPSGLAAGPTSPNAFAGPGGMMSADGATGFDESWAPPRRSRTARRKPAASKRATAPPAAAIRPK